ncbi:hypothetical protein [Sphingomonas sp.]
MIDPRYYGLIELLLVGAMAMGLGIWQLVSINRSIARDREKRSEDSAGHSVGEHRLDDR